MKLSKKSFNPTVVRLRLPKGLDLVTRLSKSFNPTVVRLRRKSLFAFSCDFNTFNPTVVRLRLTVTLYRNLAQVCFQSHCGAIATKAK